ncbi:hypothetical protein BGZ65_004606, partial [Modicella reniformis]
MTDKCSNHPVLFLFFDDNDDRDEEEAANLQACTSTRRLRTDVKNEDCIVHWNNLGNVERLKEIIRVAVDAALKKRLRVGQTRESSMTVALDNLYRQEKDRTKLPRYTIDQTLADFYRIHSDHSKNLPIWTSTVEREFNKLWYLAQMEAVKQEDKKQKGEKEQGRMNREQKDNEEPEELEEPEDP